MRLGIDGRPLSFEHLTGIGVYLKKILQYIIDTPEQYGLAAEDVYLYSDRPILQNDIANSKINVRIVPAINGTLRCSFGLVNELEKDKIDVFWGPNHIIPLNAKHIRKVVTIHDLALLVNPTWGSLRNSIIQNTFTRLSCVFANHIIADSVATQKDITRILRVPEKKITMVPLGYENKSNHVSRKTNTNYFLFVGTIEPRKNIVNIVRGFEKFCDENEDLNYHLVLAGGRGWNDAEIHQTIRQSKYRKYIHLLGFVSEERKNELYKNAKGVLMPSNYEGFGIPVLEAMFYGIPVLLSRVSSLPEVGGDLAYYVEKPEDVDSIKDNMKKIAMLNEDERKILAEKEKRWVDKFSWDMCVQRTIAALVNN